MTLRSVTKVGLIIIYGKLTISRCLIPKQLDPSKYIIIYHHYHHHHHHHHHHHWLNELVPFRVGRTAPMFVLSFSLHSILLAGSTLINFPFLRSSFIVSLHVFLGLLRPQCASTSSSVIWLIHP